MSLPSTQLILFVQEAKLPWLRFNPDTGRLEFIIDNYLASMYRACPANFMLKAVEGWSKKGESKVGGKATPGRVWPLDFGTLFHKMMEEYYKTYKTPEFSLEIFAIKTALKHWVEMKMDVHLSHRECQEIGGYPGFAGMLVQYAKQFQKENEVLNVLTSEVSFGKAREVPIYVWGQSLDTGACGMLYCSADIYLSGRMDIIADDGAFILPVDHKTMNSFYRDPADRFSIDDGPTGYIYALKHLLQKLASEGKIPSELVLKRSCSRIIINAISKKIPKEGSRFKRIALLKSEEALEAYRVRMIGTCNNILSDLELYVRGLGVPRDTSKCTNWYFRDCEFLDVHRQQSKDGEAATLQNGFLKLPIWDTEAIEPIYGESE